MCDHPNREAAMVVLDPGTPERHGRDGVWCDPCLAPLIKALNDGGLPTVASCCGHNGRGSDGEQTDAPGWIMLRDGRTLTITTPARTIPTTATVRDGLAADTAADNKVRWNRALKGGA